MLRTLVACFLAIRGLISLVILVLPNWDELKTFLVAYYSNDSSDGLVLKVAQEDMSLRPHLNIALRAEIIFFTTQVR